MSTIGCFFALCSSFSWFILLLLAHCSLEWTRNCSDCVVGGGGSRRCETGLEVTGDCYCCSESCSRYLFNKRMDPIDTFGREKTRDGDMPLIEPTAILDSESPGSKREDGRKRFVCRRVVCCCLSRTAYLKFRGSTWDTLSRNASKFGRPTRFVPSRIFEATSVILILANVAYASVYLNAFEPGLNNSEGTHDPFHNFTDIVDGTPAVWVLDIVSVIFFALEYGFRLWASVEARKYRPKKRGRRGGGLRCCGDRCRWFMKPLSLLDAAVLPVFLAAVGCLLVDGYYRSWLAEIRVVVFFRLERQVKGLSRLKSVLGSKSEELVIALFFTLVCVLYGAVAMYFVEQVFTDPQVSQPFWFLQPARTSKHRSFERRAHTPVHSFIHTVSNGIAPPGSSSKSVRLRLCFSINMF